MNTVEITQQTKAMIDGLKAVCTNFGLGNAASEYKIITEVFLYKFLNDKFIYEMKKECCLFRSCLVDAGRMLLFTVEPVFLLMGEA